MFANLYSVIECLSRRVSTESVSILSMIGSRWMIMRKAEFHLLSIHHAASDKLSRLLLNSGRGI